MSATSICSSFILGAPPGELNEVINDIKTLTSDDEPDLITKLRPAIEKYNEDQLVSVKLPGTSQHVIISAHNRVAQGRYVDTHSRKAFHFDHLTGTATLRGTVRVNVHYYEDGNVALTTTKTIADTAVGGGEAEAEAEAVVAKIAAIEKQYQEQVNRTFVSMNEQGFKALRRQLPVTRQKVDWDKIRAYNLSDTLKGARED
ncbi:hypothetical protein DV735_g4411, partial [Chaetothyriales sp. CBS 134920]